MAGYFFKPLEKEIETLPPVCYCTVPQFKVLCCNQKNSFKKSGQIIIWKTQRNNDLDSGPGNWAN